MKMSVEEYNRLIRKLESIKSELAAEKQAHEATKRELAVVREELVRKTDELKSVREVARLAFRAVPPLTTLGRDNRILGHGTDAAVIMHSALRRIAGEGKSKEWYLLTMSK